jgi:NAD+ synthase (glutamine-hydrolysing)
MPSKFNSTTTKNAAQELAGNLGCLYTVMPIDTSVENTISQINCTPVVCQNTKTEFNLTLTPFMTENIQARDRSSRLLAAAAAAFGAVFTCNANKSEMTVGYSTLYGDHAGFFAVIADLWKHQVYDLANYLNKSVYREDVIPKISLTLVPSAELSLSQNVDKGQGDPFIYPYHDYLFRAFAEDSIKPSPEDFMRWYLEGVLEEKIGCKKGIVNQIFKNGLQFTADLEKWWTLYTSLGIAKRIQAPPIFALSQSPYCSDGLEPQNGTYYTKEYFRLKKLVENKF